MALGCEAGTRVAALPIPRIATLQRQQLPLLNVLGSRISPSPFSHIRLSSRSLRFHSSYSLKPSNHNVNEDMDEVFDDLFAKYGKVVFRRNDQKPLSAEADDDAESLTYAPRRELEVSFPGLRRESDLLIVGPGVLGRMVAERWRQEHPNCQIFGQTVTTDHHDELKRVGINPFVRESIEQCQFPHVIFCAPPSRSVDYPGEVRLAASSWSGEGSFLFTSSSAVFDGNDNRSCEEDSPVVPMGRSPRTDILLTAENAVLEVGGCVLRLAGLYKFDRGAHIVWLKKGTVDAHPDHILNLIHYEDAASLAVTILKKNLRGRIFLGCDNHPLSRKEVMELVTQSGKFSGMFLGFTGAAGQPGKRLNNSKTEAELGWEPKYSSFGHFLGHTE